MPERIRNKVSQLTASLLRKTVLDFSPYILNECRIIWYQPLEPEGFEDFVNSIKAY